MTGDAHRLGGLCIGAVTAYYSTKIPAITDVMSMELFLLAPICTAIGCLFPDIDVEYSTISRRLPKLSRFVCRHTEHRMIMHSLLCPILTAVIGCLLWNFSPQLSYSILCFAMGFLFHLIQDSFTKGGIPWMYPIKRYRFHLLPMRSGSLFQWPIVFTLVFLYSEILNYFLVTD